MFCSLIGCSTSVSCIPNFRKEWKYSTLQLPTTREKDHERSRRFHRATIKGGRNKSYTSQAMEKENQKIFARANNLYRVKRAYQRKGAAANEVASINPYSHQNQEG